MLRAFNSAATALRLVVVALLLGLGCPHPASLQGAFLRNQLQSPPKFPHFPTSYQVSYTLYLPYTAKIQEHGIRYNVTFWRDARSHVRLDSGPNSIINKEGLEYELVPRMDRQRCFVWHAPGGSESETGDLMQALPDVRGWDFLGEGSVNGVRARQWRYSRWHGEKHVKYDFHVSLDGAPLQLRMYGPSMLDRAHFDEWIVDFYDYRPGPPDPTIFDSPQLCEGVPPETPELGLPHSAGSLRLRALVPAVQYAGDAAYGAFLATHGQSRRLSGLPEYNLRAELFRSNTAMIEEHNAGSHSFKLAMNRFGDWTQEEFAAMMVPSRASRRGLSDPPESKYEIPYKPLTDPARVPTGVDWRGSGADTVAVPDQANCGSCWAFGATGAMESAWFMATGQRANFSVQQVVDCGWDFGINLACNGGDAFAGIEYIAASGGIAMNEDYEYEGLDGYCRENATQRVGKFKGFSRVPPNDTLLMEAVFSRGPLTVSIDCSHPKFKFYSSGVFHDSKCRWKFEDLDHAMVLVGYGTDEASGGSSAAGDYWLLRNSWSDIWGDNGYVKISRSNHGCGVPSDAVYAVVDDIVLTGAATA